MARKSKNEKRKEFVARYAERRRELKAIVKNPATAPDERQSAAYGLARLPRDSSATRLRYRDQFDGRPRGYIRKFGLSRINFRDLAPQRYASRREESKLVKGKPWR